MRLAGIDEYRRLWFTPDSAPAPATVRLAIKEGRQPGGVILAGRYYIDLDELDRIHNLRSSLAEQQKVAAADPLLADII